jgi:hypothetical protein
VTLVDKLWTIISFMADYNYMNTHIGWVMMSNTERYGQIAVEQFGGRNNHIASLQACNKKFTLDISR